MDLKKLPYLPLQFFYNHFSPEVKRLFWMLMGALILATGLLLWSYHNPTFWSLEIMEVAEAIPEQVVVEEISTNYRTFPVSFNAFREIVSYAAGMLLPTPTPVFFYFFLQLLGWAFFLALVTQIRSQWSYLFYFIFILYFHFSGFAEAIYPDQGWVGKVVELGLLIPFLGLAHAFQVRILQWNLIARVPAFGALLLVIFGWTYFQGGWTTLHAIHVNQFGFLTLLSLPFLFFIAKEPTNLIIAGATNRPQQEARMSKWMILLTYVFYLVMVFLIANQYLRLDAYFGFPVLSAAGIGIRPMHLLALSALIAVFTAQNHYHYVKRVMTSNSTFSLGLMSLGIIFLSHFALIFAEGDYQFRFSLDRILAFLFCFVAIGHVLFIFLNHGRLLKEKVNLYYLLTQGPRVPFAMVWVIALIGFVLVEGSNNWVSYRLYGHSYSLQKGDLAYLAGDVQEARKDYSLANQLVISSVKGHYNFAIMNLVDRKELTSELIAGSISEYEAIKRFPYAALNAGNLNLLGRNTPGAFEVLSRQAQSSQNPYVANNLGVLYLKGQEADSAIVYLKMALEKDLGLSAAYSNLAQVYLENDKPQVGTEILQAAIDLPEPSSAALSTAMCYALKGGVDLDLSDISPKKEEDYGLAFTYFLYQLQHEKGENLAVRAKQLAEGDPIPDAIILDAWMRFREDSIAQAISRMEFVASSYKVEAKKAYYVLGAAYYEKGVPEMARKYFEKSGDAGDPKGYLYAAKMDLDLGFHERAQRTLSLLRVDHEGLWNEASKELALLLLAYSYDNPTFALSEYDITTLSRDERMRVSLYADSLSGYIPALENFRQLLAEDSTDVSPYLEMGRIYDTYKDPIAIENLEYGLQKEPENTALLLEKARGYLTQGQFEEMNKTLDQLGQGDTLSLDAAQLIGEMKLAQGDTTGAVGYFKSVHLAGPLRQRPVVLLAGIYSAQEDYEAGNQLIAEVLDINTENPEIWYYYGIFSRAWNQIEDARFAAKRAIELSPSSRFHKRVRKEFEAEW